MAGGSVKTSEESPTNNNSSLAMPPVAAVELSRQTVFRLILDDGRCRLETIEKVNGDFRKRRVRRQLHPGMLSCRLISTNGAILNEQFIHAPDHVCAVLNTNRIGKEPEVLLLAGLGPQLFQVRFPESPSADQLEIHRVTATSPLREQSLLLTVPFTQ